MTSVYKELSRIQKELKAPKNRKNSFGKYAYRNAEDILEAVKGVLGECYILISDTIEVVGDRHYIKSTAMLGIDDMQISNCAYAREALTKKGMDDAQITGSASSYARKYALNGLFAIDDSKDDPDSKDNRETYQVPTNQTRKATALQVKEVLSLIESTHTKKETTEKWLRKAGVSDFTEMNFDDLQKCIDMLLIIQDEEQQDMDALAGYPTHL